ncbi:DUF4346 domain-containing protein [Candidatus Woesearchaeota archaeon]|nr:DUF4346 domain-containing protein [Candidatus Woesearchaeota archaeon]
MIKGMFFEITPDIRETIDTRKFPKTWDPDEKGYFLIKINRGLIEVGFVTSRHRLTKRLIGNNAEEMLHAIIRKGLVSKLAHAAYLGRELAKAEIALKRRKKYTQS